MPNTISVFKTPEGEAQYLAAYEAALKSWPAPFDELYISTRFGETHVIAGGPKEAPPLILLHGMSFAALSWMNCIPYLNQHFRTYAPDTLNDLGKSRLWQPITGREDFAAWLVELFAGLQVERPFVAGHSYGGWLAMGLELSHPGTCKKLALISPAASFYPYPLAFLARGIGISFFPSPSRIASLVRWMTADGYEVREQDVELFYLGLKNYRPPRSILANVFSDQELGQIKAPALLMIGENEVIYKPEKAIARASQWMPNLTSTILPGAGHGSIIEKPEEVSRLLVEYLQKSDS